MMEIVRVDTATEDGWLSPRLERARLGMTAGLLAIAYLLGGTSGEIPLRGMLIELFALATFVFAVITWRGPRPPALAIAFLLACVALPLLQLVPLPPSLWTVLPGRAVAADIVALAAPGAWHPLSLDPDRTLASWLCLLPPIAMFLMAVQLTVHQRALVLGTFVALAVVSVLLGIVQISTGSFYPYPLVQPVVLPNGLFSNRNHQATFMVAAAIAAISLGRYPPFRDPYGRFLLPALALVFGAVVFATGSRAGMVLLTLPLLLAIVPLVRVRIDWRWALLVVVLVLVVLGFMSQSAIVQRALGRFANQASEGRFNFWPDVVFAMTTYFPAGAGMGTFVKAYQATEGLGTLTEFYINRGHDEYLELLLETGLAGALLMVVLAVFVIRSGWRILASHRGDSTARLCVAALLVILVLALHSLADYPLRTFADLTLLGLLFALLVPPVDEEPRRTPRPRPLKRMAGMPTGRRSRR